MTGRNEAGQPWYTAAHISVGIRDVLFPLNVDLLLMLLPEAGYVVQANMPRARPFRARLEVQAGDLARKGDFSLSLNSERGHLGVIGPDPTSVAEEFQTLLDFATARLGIEIEVHAAFYEFLAEGILQTGKSPLKTFASLSAKMQLFDGLTNLFRNQVGLYGVRLVRPLSQPNSPDWLELTIEPAILESEKNYAFNVVVRNSILEPTLDFAKSFAGLLTRVVGQLEVA